MPSRKIPNSINGFIRALKKAGVTYNNTPAPERAISQELFGNVDPDEGSECFLQQLLKEQREADAAAAARGALTDQGKELFEKLAMHVSHFHRVLDMGIQRGDFQPAARAYYEREIHASVIPDISNYDDALELADIIIAGETSRQTAEGTNFMPMALPSAAKIGNLKNQFATLRNQTQTAGSADNREHEEVQALFDQARALVIEIWDTVEFFYRKDPDPGSRRQKCSEWGVVYVSLPGEEPEAPPATPPTPPPN